LHGEYDGVSLSEFTVVFGHLVNPAKILDMASPGMTIFLLNWRELVTYMLPDAAFTLTRFDICMLRRGRSIMRSVDGVWVIEVEHVPWFALEYPIVLLHKLLCNKRETNRKEGRLLRLAGRSN